MTTTNTDNDLRIRRVERFVITHYQRDSASGSASVRTLGEFDSQSVAEEIANALWRDNPGATLTTVDNRLPSRHQIGDIVTYKSGRHRVDAVHFQFGKVLYVVTEAPLNAAPDVIFDSFHALSEDVYPWPMA